MPFRPIDFPGSGLRMKSATYDVVMSGILKNVSDGTLLLTELINLDWSTCAVFWVEFSRKQIFVKYSLSLHAISWESVITEPLIFNWPGNNLEDLCVLFCFV